MFWQSIKSRVQGFLAKTQMLRTSATPPRFADTRRLAPPDGAERLLLGYLTPAQRDTYERHGWFIVQGPSGRRYSIRKRDSLYCNITELGGYGQTVAQLCACAAIRAPVGDHLLTQKLMLEHHEEEFRRIANRT